MRMFRREHSVEHSHSFPITVGEHSAKTFACFSFIERFYFFYQENLAREHNGNKSQMFGVCSKNNFFLAKMIASEDQPRVCETKMEGYRPIRRMFNIIRIQPVEKFRYPIDCQTCN
jgi:hypothetical protein